MSDNKAQLLRHDDGTDWTDTIAALPAGPRRVLQQAVSAGIDWTAQVARTMDEAQVIDTVVVAIARTDDTGLRRKASMGWTAGATGALRAWPTWVGPRNFTEGHRTTVALGLAYVTGEQA